mmetsp:Transcript_73976/g.187613  ORF Transcript_73976/g.187613 Transcript_73976/m.187613 type:complete len:283 (+) Transcript_73976:854-1702(+)
MPRRRPHIHFALAALHRDPSLAAILAGTELAAGASLAGCHLLLLQQLQGLAGFDPADHGAAGEVRDVGHGDGLTALVHILLDLSKDTAVPAAHLQPTHGLLEDGGPSHAPVRPKPLLVRALHQLDHVAWDELSGDPARVLHHLPQRRGLRAPQVRLRRALQIHGTRFAPGCSPTHRTIAEQADSEPGEAKALILLGVANGFHDLADGQLAELADALPLEILGEGDFPSDAQERRQGRNEGSQRKAVGGEPPVGHPCPVRWHGRFCLCDEVAELLLANFRCST